MSSLAKLNTKDFVAKLTRDGRVRPDTTVTSLRLMGNVVPDGPHFVGLDVRRGDDGRAVLRVRPLTMTDDPIYLTNSREYDLEMLAKAESDDRTNEFLRMVVALFILGVRDNGSIPASQVEQLWGLAGVAEGNNPLRRKATEIDEPYVEILERLKTCSLILVPRQPPPAEAETDGDRSIVPVDRSTVPEEPSPEPEPSQEPATSVKPRVARCSACGHRLTPDELERKLCLTCGKQQPA